MEPTKNETIDQPTENGTIDQKLNADHEVDQLLKITAGARFFRSIEGHFHARVLVNDRQEILGLRSAVFRDWLVGGFLQEHRKLPSQRSVGRVLQALEASARFDRDHARRCTCASVSTRRTTESVDYLDLADAGGHAVRIMRIRMVGRRSARRSFQTAPGPVAVTDAQP